MDFLNNIEQDSILVIPNNIKDKVLSYLDGIDEVINIKIMSFYDLKKGLFFDYTNEAIYYIMQHYHVNYGVAKNYINDLYNITEVTYDNDKLNFLLEIKNDLDKHNMLIKDDLFTNLLKSKNKLYVFGFDYIKKYEHYLLDIASKYIKLIILDKETKDLVHEVYNLETMEQEVSFVAESVAKLVDKGIDMNKIFIANYSDDYYFTFNRIFKSYGIPFYIKSETTLYTTAMGSYFINTLSDNLDLLLYKIRKRFNTDTNKINEIVYNRLTSLVNNYYWADNILDIKDLIIEEMRTVKIPVRHHVNEIKTTSILDNYFTDDEYVFLIGFNLGSIPKLKRDEDYIDDAIKPHFLDKTDEYNKNVKDAYLKAIGNIKNIIITYKTSSAFSSFYPSFLIDGKQLINKRVDWQIAEYAPELNKLNLAKKIDNLIKFNEYDESLEKLNSTYSIEYATYDNKFTGIDENELRSVIDGNIVFSYSNITTYYKCPFQFYINSILKVKEYEQTLEQFIGSLFHYCLEKCLDNDVDVDNVYDEFIEQNREEKEFSNKDLFFIKILRKEIHFVIDAIKEQYTHSAHNETWHEKRIEYDVERKIKATIKGFVDNILVLNNNALVIDYKTNNTTVDKDLFAFGISIQLPIYLYLLKQLDSNIEVAGLYLQHILNLDMKYDPKKDVIEEKKKKLKLDGITFDDIDKIKIFDDTYEKSEVIQSLKIDKKLNAFKLSKRVLSCSDKDSLYELMENLIMTCIDNVSDAKFAIHPLKIMKKADGCEYCRYKDICYRKPKDFNNQELKSTEGDDDNE